MSFTIRWRVKQDNAWKGDEAGRYWVPINGEWVQVPKEAVIYNSRSPISEAVVWYTNFNDEGGIKYIFIRCFVPGDGV
jgi:hypothetical protein